MRFVVDAQLPPALARLLVAKGHDAAIVTKDEDFAQRHALTGSGPRVVWIRLRNTRRHDLLRWIETALPNIVSALEQGETLIEVV